MSDKSCVTHHKNNLIKRLLVVVSHIETFLTSALVVNAKSGKLKCNFLVVVSHIENMHVKLSDMLRGTNMTRGFRSDIYDALFSEVL